MAELALRLPGSLQMWLKLYLEKRVVSIKKYFIFTLTFYNDVWYYLSMKKKILNTELAKMTGLSTVQVSYIITGASGCTRKTAEALSKACADMGVTVEPHLWAYGDRDELKTLLGR